MRELVRHYQSQGTWGLQPDYLLQEAYLSFTANLAFLADNLARGTRCWLPLYHNHRGHCLEIREDSCRLGLVERRNQLGCERLAQLASHRSNVCLQGRCFFSFLLSSQKTLCSQR